ncbi:MAG: hypothetical protein JWM19_1007 [Actinomycetia bacterium]|nr:hypothetical protein [Actinomycetes bacterium]
MPQVLSDPQFTSVITNGGTDLFSYPAVAHPSVLGLQTPATQPLPPGTASATNLLNPDLQVAAQLRNFPPGVYDLSPSSLLVHFMSALLGGGGTGQLRKRQMVARLQQAVTSTQFYDLDSLYGALFGAQRGPSGALPVDPGTGVAFNPYGALASPDAWDEVQAIDARYRERVIQLARAITLGGTVPGMQALGEAISGAPCQVYEVWRLLDNAQGPLPGYQTWEQVMTSFPQWSSFPASQAWQGVEGIVSFAGLLGSGAPNEIVVAPRKSYAGDVAGLAERGADMFGIVSVAEVLKPAATLVSVDASGMAVMSPVPISAAWADSENWEVIQLVTPSSPSDPAYAAIASSYQGTNAAELPTGTYATPVPPLSRSAGSQYSYAADVTAVTARAVTGSSPNGAVVTSGQDFETVFFAGKPVQYLPAQAVMPAQQAATARTASPVTVKSAPYSGPRVPVMTAS